MSTDDFTLIPADDDQITAEDDLEAAAQSALLDGEQAVDPEDEGPIPFGRTWAFDYERQRFVRHGLAPAEVRGADALAQWCLMALHAARYAHPVFSEDFGTERPDDLIGEAQPVELLADFEDRMRDALLVHDRIAEVADLKATYDPASDVVAISDFTVITDEGDDVIVPEARVTGRSF